MSQTSVNICPCCDAVINPDDNNICPCCGSHVTVSSSILASMPTMQVGKYAKGYSKMLANDPDNQELNGYAAMCYLRLRLYDRAMPLFEKAIDENFESAEPYFMAAICLLRGKIPFVAQRADINKALDYLNAAVSLDEKAIHHLLLGYIKQDYFDRKFLNIDPSTQDEYDRAKTLGLTEDDEKTLETLLAVNS